MKTVSSIGVIVGLDLIGDGLIKLPFARALRAVWPYAEIHWITAKGPTVFSGPLREMTKKLINVVDDQPDWMATMDRPARSPAPHFDIVFDTRNNWREARIARRHIPHGLFIAQAMHFLFSSRRPSLWRPHPPRLIDRLLQMIEIAAERIPDAGGQLPVPESFLEKARQLLPDGKTFVGLSPGAGNRAKVWPLPGFQGLAALQASRGHTPVFILGPDEMEWVEPLKSAVPSALFPLQERVVWGAEKMSLNETLAIACRLNVAVANDSGTSHMLAAVDCPLVSLFGPTSPAKLAPKVSAGCVVRAQDFGGEAMEFIPVSAVDRAVESLLSVWQ